MKILCDRCMQMHVLIVMIELNGVAKNTRIQER